MSNGVDDCKYCRNITLETLSNGYLHAPTRSSLVRSAQKCRFCSLLFRKDRSRNGGQLFLKLESFSDEDPQVCLRISHVQMTANGDVTEPISFFLYTSLGMIFAPESPVNLPENFGCAWHLKELSYNLKRSARFLAGEVTHIPIGDPATEIGVNIKRPLSNTASAESFVVAKRWISDCLRTHECSTRLPLKEQETSRSLLLGPSRLVDVEAFKPPSQDVRLIDNDGTVERYITLSYCWGKSRTFVTTARALRLRKTRIVFKYLPKTFRDAIKIARQLGIRYVWIDALCIIQDDRLDWANESAKMGAIYSTSFLTVAADSSTDCLGGCFNTRSIAQDAASDNSPFELVTSAPDGRESRLYLWDPGRGARRFALPDLDESPLSERGWCCQERILSPRILHFARSQLFWECRQCLLAEDNLRPWALWHANAPTASGLARNLYGTTTDPTSRDHLLNIWYHNVVSQSYSKRKLTNPDDKLIAISGIARAFHRHLQSDHVTEQNDYVAGVWAHLDLAWGLSWRRRGPVTKPPAYRAPSFSWASLDATVEWPPRHTSGRSSIYLEDIHIELDGQDPFGRVSSASIRVTGMVREATVVARKRMSAGVVDYVWELRSTRSNKWLGTAYMDVDTEGDHETEEYVTCLVLSSHEGSERADILLLEEIDVMGLENAYVRKGVAELLGYEVDSQYSEYEERQTLTIY